MAMDFRVRRGKARSHRVNAALDRFKERQSGPNPPTTSLRIVVEMNLPRGQERPSRLEYQRITSWMIDCRTPEAAGFARRAFRDLIRKLDYDFIASDGVNTPGGLE